MIERGKLAEALSNQRGNEFNGLVLGVKAIDVRSGGEPPAEAVHGLRKAIATIGNTNWLRGVSTPVEKVEFSLDGRRVLTRSKNEIQVFDSVTGESIFRKGVTLGAKWKSVGLSPDGTMAFTIEAISPEGQSEAGDIQDTSDEATPAGSNKYLARIWDTQSQQLLEMYQPELANTDSLVFSKNGKRILTSSDKKLHVLDSSTGRLIVTISITEIDTEQLRFSPEGSRIVTVTKKGEAELWDAITGKRITTLIQVDPGSYILREFSNDDSQLLVGKYTFSGSPSVTLWNAKDGRRMFTIQVPESSLRRGVMSGEKRIILYTGSYDSSNSKALIYEESSGKLLEVKNLENANFINHPAFFSVSATALVGIENPFIKDPQLKSYLARYREPNDGENKTSNIFLWNFLSDEKRQVVTEYPARFSYISATPDLELIATVSEDEVVQIWGTNLTPLDVENLSISQLKEIACKKLRYQDEFKEVADLCQ